MKKVKLPLIYLAYTSLSCMFLVSCKKEETLVQSSLTTEEVDFKGERVVVTNDMQKSLLNMSPEEFAVYYDGLHRTSNLRTSEEGYSILSYEELVQLVTPYLNVYPDLSWEKEISQKDMEMIFNDLPSIKSEEDIRNKGHIIYEYYASIALQKILPAVIEYKRAKMRNGNSSKVSDDTNFANMTGYEESVLQSNPLFIPHYVAASATARITFGDSDNDRSNAAKHAAWNAHAMRNIILSGIFKDPATTYVRKGTSAHEMTSPGGAWQFESQNLMDLNSNMVGRSWMDDNTSWGIGPLRVMPTVAAINHAMTIRRDGAYKMTYDWHVLDRYPPGGTSAWTILYTHNTGVNPYLLYLVD